MSGVVVWITGLPSCGKSTFAEALASRLTAAGVAVCILDSDVVRKAIFSGLGYRSRDRDTFYAALGKLAGLLASQGQVVIVAATAHRRKYRKQARDVAPKLIEVYIRTDIEECKQRDTKGLYVRAAAGELQDVPGVHTAYEEPIDPTVVAEDGRCGEAMDEVVARVREALSDEVQ